ncbi:MAG TPA: hypothetical protein VMS22_11990 [Candidatus Eisenbacteria bacterium]|nr:hypothetical protein [Candidatus Eisenbacteria bacterium]
MDDDVASRLEEAVAELGTLLLQMEKFAAGRGGDAAALRAASLSIGDRARRAHRHGVLDPALAGALLADAEASRTGLEAWLAGARGSASYRAAAAAVAGGDRDAVARAIVDVFDGAAVAPPPDALYHPVTWQRRGRPRPAADIAAGVAELRRSGLVGENDPAAFGVDPALPAVVLHRAPPQGAPLALVLRGAALPAWVMTLPVTDDVFVPGARFVTPFAVALAALGDDIDDWVLDPEELQRSLRAALGAHGVPIVAS